MGLAEVLSEVLSPAATLHAGRPHEESTRDGAARKRRAASASRPAQPVENRSEALGEMDLDGFNFRSRWMLRTSKL